MNLPFPGNFRSRIEPKDSVTFLFRCVLQKSFAPAWERLCFRAEILKVEFMKTIFIKPQSIERKWYLIDAEGQSLGRVAAAAAKIIKGKNKVEYVPHQEIGDYVIIINAAKAKVTGNKVEDKIQKSPATKWKIRFIIAIQCIQADSRLSLMERW